MPDACENPERTYELFSDPKANGAWFGGALEIGSTAIIGVSQYTDKSGVARIKTQPQIEIHSTSQPMLDRLYATYGGMRRPRFWSKGGKVAAEIVASTLPYTVARREHAIAMQNWLEAESVEEQIEIARSLQATETWQQKGETEAYLPLLEDPSEVGGILDARSYFALRPARNFHTLYKQTTSKNVALLNALQFKFGGRVRITDLAGKKVNYGDVVFETLADTYVWELIGAEAISLAKFALPYMLTTLPEGWDYQRAPEKDKEVSKLIAQISQLARAEMQQLQAGEISQISTNAQLAEAFGIHPVSVIRYLKLGLTDAERKERKRKIKDYARRTIDAVMAKRFIASVGNEVMAYQQGQIDRLSLNDELAERFGVSKRALQRHVLAHLGSDLQTARQAILRSQITRDRNIAYFNRMRSD